jgi:hypothetical protein
VVVLIPRTLAIIEKYFPFGYGTIPILTANSEPFLTIPVVIVSVVTVVIVGAVISIYMRERKR